MRKANAALESETDPLVKAFYIPCSILVGPQYEIAYDVKMGKFNISDNFSYENREISDNEFVKLRKEYTKK